VSGESPPEGFSQYLERVRASPFLRVPESFVRARAFFSSQANPGRTPAWHWLRAEETETCRVADATLVNLRDESLCDANVRFDAVYRPLRRWCFAPGDSGHTPTEGSQVPRRCSICGRTGASHPPASFRKVAHLVPELLGNRWLKTFDECDDCNERFGREYEDDLGKMTGAIRALGGVRAKRGTAKHKPRGGQEADGTPRKASSIGGNALGSPVTISLHPGDDSVAIHHDDPRGFTLSAETQPFRPGRAAKALARVAWQALPADRRPAHSSLRDYLRAPGPPLEERLFTAWVPGLHGLHVGLWELSQAQREYPGSTRTWSSPSAYPI